MTTKLESMPLYEATEIVKVKWPHPRICEARPDFLFSIIIIYFQATHRGLRKVITDQSSLSHKLHLSVEQQSAYRKP